MSTANMQKARWCSTNRLLLTCLLMIRLSSYSSTTLAVFTDS